MSIYSFNKGMDDGHFGKLPDEKKMLNDRDYFEGYCMAEDIEERHDYEEKCRKDYEEYMKRKQEEDFKIMVEEGEIE